MSRDAKMEKEKSRKKRTVSFRIRQNSVTNLNRRYVCFREICVHCRWSFRPSSGPDHIPCQPDMHVRSCFLMDWATRYGRLPLCIRALVRIKQRVHNTFTSTSPKAARRIADFLARYTSSSKGSVWFLAETWSGPASACILWANKTGPSAVYKTTHNKSTKMLVEVVVFCLESGKTLAT
jgi:hypothetical protein